MKKLNSWKSWNLILICICINIIGRKTALALELPFWFDAIGTMVAAIEYGPIVGAFCGVLANLLISSGDAVAFPYLFVSAGIGISAGLFFPRNNSSYLRKISSAVLTGLVAAVISTPSNLMMYGGKT